MQEIKILEWCDFCWLTTDERIPAVDRWTVGMNKGDKGPPPVRVLVVCERHNDQLKALHGIWSEVATMPERVTETPRRSASNSDGSPYRRASECPICHAVYSTASMVGHIWGKHRPDDRPPFPKVCDTCGAPTPTPQGYATHRRLVHHFDAVEEALAGVPGYGHQLVKQSA